MGTFIHKFGTLSIPKDRQAAFIEDAKAIADKGGLFSTIYTSIFGKRLWLLSFPSFERAGGNDCADFSYSFFEKGSWENAGIDLKECEPYSGKVGYRHFNQAVQALYFLAESYSDKLFVSCNDSLNRPEMTIEWIRYALNRDISFPFRKNIWTVYESVAEEDLDYYGKVRSSLVDILSDYSCDEIDYDSLLEVNIVDRGSEKFSEMAEKSQSNKKDDDGLSCHDLIRIYRNGVEKYKESSDLDEEGQIKFLLSLFTCEDSEREVYKANNQLFGVMLGTIFISPVIATKIVSEIYNKDFWNLWKTIKNHITVTTTMKMHQDIGFEKNKTLSTEKYFSCCSDDRLYWWGRESDVVMSEKTENDLRECSKKHSLLCSRLPEGDITVWQKRFAGLLAAHPNIICFEEMFYEFIGSFHDDRFKAAVMLLEETADNKDEYRRLISVFANRKLRDHIFSF